MDKSELSDTNYTLIEKYDRSMKMIFLKEFNF